MEIVVLDKQSDKLIRMSVQPKHTIGSIIETIVDKQRLDKNQRYKIVKRDKSFGKEDYLLTLQKAGINEGDHVFLEVEALEQLKAEEGRKEPKLEKEAKPERKVRRLEPEKKEPAEKLCTKCGSKLKWIEGFKRWYCYNCHKYQD